MHSWKQGATPPPKSIENVRKCILKSISHGINHFETASGYGTSELEMGYTLRDIPRDSFILTTKVTPKDSNDEF